MVRRRPEGPHRLGWDVNDLNELGWDGWHSGSQLQVSHTAEDFWVYSRRRLEPLRTNLRLQRTKDGGVACVGIWLERTDGQAVTARDLRTPVGALLERIGGLAPWLHGTTPQPVRPARPGPKGHPDDHWRNVLDLWQRAQVHARRSPVSWMRQQWQGVPVSDATMRRWRDRALEWQQQQKNPTRRSEQ